VTWGRRITLVFACVMLSGWLASIFVKVWWNGPVQIVLGHQGIIINRTFSLSAETGDWEFAPLHSWYSTDIRFQITERPTISFRLPNFVTIPPTNWPGLLIKRLLIPHWLTNLLVWSPFFILWRKSRKPAPGHCQGCGYDLTGNQSGRCPECDRRVDADMNAA